MTKSKKLEKMSYVVVFMMLLGLAVETQAVSKVEIYSIHLLNNS